MQAIPIFGRVNARQTQDGTNAWLNFYQVNARQTQDTPIPGWINTKSMQDVSSVSGACDGKLLSQPIRGEVKFSV
jgi:hypothetical protein